MKTRTNHTHISKMVGVCVMAALVTTGCNRSKDDASSTASANSSTDAISNPVLPVLPPSTTTTVIASIPIPSAPPPTIPGAATQVVVSTAPPVAVAPITSPDGPVDVTYPAYIPVDDQTGVPIEQLNFSAGHEMTAFESLSDRSSDEIFQWITTSSPNPQGLDGAEVASVNVWFADLIRADALVQPDAIAKSDFIIDPAQTPSWTSVTPLNSLILKMPNGRLVVIVAWQGVKKPGGIVENNVSAYVFRSLPAADGPMEEANCQDVAATCALVKQLPPPRFS